MFHLCTKPHWIFRFRVFSNSIWGYERSEIVSLLFFCIYSVTILSHSGYAKSSICNDTVNGYRETARWTAVYPFNSTRHEVWYNLSFEAAYKCFFIAESYSEPFQTLKMELFPKIVNSWNLLSIFMNCSILKVNRLNGVTI